MDSRKESKKKFARYLRSQIQRPADWNTNLFGDFPGTVSMMQKYFGYILEKAPNSEKAKAIETHYNLQQYDSLEKKIEIIDGKPRSIEKFFRKETIPYEKNLNFIALVFEAPIKNMEDFVATPSLHAKPAAKKQVSNKPTTKAQRNSLHPSKLNMLQYAAGIVLLAGLVFFALRFFKDRTLHAESKQKTPRVAQIKTASLFPMHIHNKLFIRKVSHATPTTTNDSVEPGLFYHTVNIFNDKCVYKKKGAWSFDTDPKGEDMNSPYGTPFNEDIHGIYNMLNGQSTLANQSMDIHFNIENRTDKKLVFSAFKLKITDSYSAKTEQAAYNLYQARGDEPYFEILLDGKNIYPYTTNKETIARGESLFCRLRVKTGENCTERICRFKIVCDLVDTRGNHYRVESDKNYFIAHVEQK